METAKTGNLQILTFLLDSEIYGINVKKIKEVLEVPRITRIPKSLPYMAGVINIRGNIIPLVDLRKKFDLEETMLSENTSIVIIEIQFEKETILMGILVDEVKKVVKIQADSLEPPPKIGLSIDTRFINSLGKHNDNLVIILNSDNIFQKDELSKVSSVTTDPLNKEVANENL